MIHKNLTGGKVVMEFIIKYAKAAINALLALFGKDPLDEEVLSNLDSMINNILGYEPEN